MLIQIRNAFLVKQAKTEVLRLAYSYTVERSDMANVPALADEARAAFRKFSKTYDTDNMRKVRSANDLLFLSWMHAHWKAGRLEELLDTDPWSLPPDEIMELSDGLEKSFNIINEKAKNAKTWRNLLRSEMNGLAASEKTGPVCPTNPSPVCKCQTVTVCSMWYHTGAGLQGLRALMVQWSWTMMADTSLSGAGIEAEGIPRPCIDLAKIDEMLSWPASWGPLGDNSEDSPFAVIHRDRQPYPPTKQDDKQLLSTFESLTMVKLFSASGEQSAAGMQFFQRYHKLLVWKAPVPDFEQTNEETQFDEGTESDDNPEADTDAPVPMRHADAAVKGPRRGYMIVAGVFMLNRVLPFLVRPAPCHSQCQCTSPIPASFRCYLNLCRRICSRDTASTHQVTSQTLWHP